MINRPEKGFGMRHVALFVHQYEACEEFYTHLLGMEVEWRPDSNNVYMTSGSDNLALHRSNNEHPLDETTQRLDHIGFFMKSPEDVDAWFCYLSERGVRMRTEPRTHRDGARSFYCYDPDGTHVQIIYHAAISDWDQLEGIN